MPDFRALVKNDIAELKSKQSDTLEAFKSAYQMVQECMDSANTLHNSLTGLIHDPNVRGTIDAQEAEDWLDERMLEYFDDLVLPLNETLLKQIQYDPSKKLLWIVEMLQATYPSLKK